MKAADIQLKRTMFEEIDSDTKTFEDGVEGLHILKLAYTTYKKSGDLGDFVALALGTRRTQSTKGA